MHEMSLVNSLLKQVESIVAENAAQTATQIAVEIGPLAGVEIELVRSAFEQRVLGTVYERTRLVIDEVSLVIRCLSCQTETALDRFVFRCGNCRSGHVQVIGGDEFRLCSINIVEASDHD